MLSSRLLSRIARAPVRANVAVASRLFSSSSDFNERRLSLHDALEYERNYTMNAEASEPSLADIAKEMKGWVVKDSPNSSIISFTKKTSDYQVVVEVDCNIEVSDFDASEVYENENEDGSNPENSEGEKSYYVRGLVTITRPGRDHVLQIGIFLNDSLRVHRINSVPASAAATLEKSQNSVFKYVGPDYEDLDEVVQDNILNYVVAVGLDEEAASQIWDYVTVKEQADYLGWLKEIQAHLA